MTTDRAEVFGSDATLRRRALTCSWPVSGQRMCLPKFWGDLEVRGFLAAVHRQMTIDQARNAVAARFGEVRAPSRAAIHRFWQALDGGAA